MVEFKIQIEDTTSRELMQDFVDEVQGLLDVYFDNAKIVGEVR